MGQRLEFEPDGYLEWVRTAVPGYDALQEAAIEAIPGVPKRVLDLGVGIGESSRRLLRAFPEAQITGLDSNPEMVFRAREMGIEVRLARMEDPLPDGPWDLVIAVLSVHHLQTGAKRDLFRRIREQSKSLVLGDVVAVEEHRVQINPDRDYPEAASDMADWTGGRIVWQQDDLAVITASY